MLTRAKNRADAFLPVIVILALLGIGYYYLYNHYLANPCGVPVRYAIGDVDSRFKISSDTVTKVAKEAAERWNTTSGENLLEYDPNSAMKINLVYDERQANVDEINSKIGTLNSSGNAIADFRTDLQNKISRYKKDLANYNSTVEYWNLHGGAPADIYSQLQSAKVSLDQRLTEINSSAALLNEQVDTHNSNLDQLNSEIDSDKNTIVTEGLYYTSERKIDIFTFGNQDELKLVLMHELGHAISLDHDAKPTSIMYPILGKQDLVNPEPSAEDLNMYKTTCKTFGGRFKTFWQNIFNRTAQPAS